MTDGPSWPADQVERRAVALLVPYARNARTHSKAQVDQLAASIREWGWTTPVLVDEANAIIAGHGRVLAAQQLGLADVPVMVARGWSEAQTRAYVIADNKLALNAGWDENLLRGELTDLRGGGVDLSLLGFSTADLTDLFNDGEASGQTGAGSLAAAFGIPPFSVLSARDGWWQDRKRAWIALGIQSELGRGADAVSYDSQDKLDAFQAAKPLKAVPVSGGQGLNMTAALAGRAKAKRAANAEPGGSKMPAADYSKKQRGDGRGRPM